jgi:hypothetical protein
LTQTTESSREVRLHGRCANIEKFSYFAGRPLVTVNEDNGDSLTFGKLTKAPGQLRLVPRLVVCRGRKQLSRLPDSGPALADSVEITKRVFHLAHLVPVLPRITQSVGRSITPSFPAVAGNEGAVKPRFN